MEDFFDKFRDNLENRPPSSFNEEDWKGLEQKLDQLDKPSRRSSLVWLIIPLLLLSAGSNGYLLYRLFQQPIATSQASFKTDTVWRHRVIYQTDTIYRTKVIYETLDKGQLSNKIPQSTPKDHFTFTSSKWTRFIENSFSNKNIGTTPDLYPPYQLNALHQFLPSRPYAISSVWYKKSSIIDSKDRYGLSPILPMIEIPILDAPFYFPNDAPLVFHDHKGHKRSFAQQLSRLRPVGLMGGIATGITQFTNELDGQHPAWSVGIHGAVLFSPKLRLWMDLNYTKNNFETQSMNETIGIPVVQGPSDDFVFTKAETSIPAYLLGIGMKYIISPDRTWTPFLGAGYGKIFTQSYEISYEFENPNLAIEYNLEKQVNRQVTISDYLILKAGMETRLNKNWLGQIGLTYQTNLDKPSLQWQNLFQLQGKVLYHF